MTNRSIMCVGSRAHEGAEGTLFGAETASEATNESYNYLSGKQTIYIK